MTPAPGRGLAIFDIDGTLTMTNALDEECYEASVVETLGVTGFSTDWGGYRHSTDSGILTEIVATHCGRTASGRDIRGVREKFINLVKARSVSGDCCREVRGAAGILDALPSMGWDVAIATGGWGTSARRKLEVAGIRGNWESFASADDALTRTDIIAWAVRRACARRGAISSSGTTIPCVYIGDGIWDVQAARSCGFGFVGIGSGERALRLVKAGVQCVLEDYQDQSRFESALDEAASGIQGRYAPEEQLS
ncbi:MAG: HAD family hydrolase [Phycisphaerales bacterium]|nr:HAD family hydrolase [Phycisphaerales bacterium]